MGWAMYLCIGCVCISLDILHLSHLYSTIWTAHTHYFYFLSLSYLSVCLLSLLVAVVINGGGVL